MAQSSADCSASRWWRGPIGVSRLRVKAETNVVWFFTHTAKTTQKPYAHEKAAHLSGLILVDAELISFFLTFAEPAGDRVLGRVIG